MMQNFIDAFPLIYALWGGILIVWGFLINLGFLKIIQSKRLKWKSARKSDKLNILAITTITCLNVFSLFMKHDATQYILDALILGHFWCTIYYSAITYTHMRCLPKLSKRNSES